MSSKSKRGGENSGARRSDAGPMGGAAAKGGEAKGTTAKSEAARGEARRSGTGKLGGAKRGAANGEPGRGRKALFSLLILALWGLLFLALEVGLRIGGYGNDYRLFREMEGGILVDNPDYTKRFFSPADRPDPARPVNLLQREKDPSRIRVFVVGESTAQGFPYQKGHAFGSIAGRALAAQGIDIEVINLGNSALSSYYVREVLHDIEEYDPDLVVIYAGHNEYYGSPSSFTGGNHRSRLAVLALRKLRSFQLFEAIVIRLSRRKPVEGVNLMERRFNELLHPADPESDRAVAELFVRNVRSGVAPFLKMGVPVLLFEPVSNLVSMPPFRSTRGAAVGSGRPSALSLYEAALATLEGGGEWDRRRWEEIRDLDEAPFRARSALAEAAAEWTSQETGITWIPTADEMEARAGARAFTDDYFIDHLHFNFEGQTLIASILAEAMAKTLFPDRSDLEVAFAEHFADPARVRESVLLTEYWEFDAYSIVVALMEQEPFRSMPIPKAIPLTPERIEANPLYADRDLLSLYRGALPGEDLFHLTLEYYAERDREEWIRNLNAYVYLFPANPTAHLAYGIALLSDDPEGNLAMASSYLRRAFILSERSEEMRRAIRSEFERVGVGSLYPAFELQYLR